MSSLYQHPGLVIPAYQPDQQLLRLVEALRQQRPEQLIIVVNDGSDPHTHDIFLELKQHRVEVLHHPRNLGKGQALKTAFNHYLKLIGDQALGVVTADADGQHSVEDILALSDALAQAGQHLHLGVRDFKKKTVPLRSKLGNLLTGYIFRTISATSLYDTQTGLRGIPVNLIKSVLLSQYRGYELEMEMLLLAARQQIRMNQIPVKTIYFNHNAQSHFNPLRDSWKIYRVVLRFLFS
jgi:glycosyltransferase involved in cell wall biosynthesis